MSSIEDCVRALIAAGGTDIDVVTDKTLAPYAAGAPALCAFAWPAVRSLVHKLQRRRARDIEELSFGLMALSDGELGPAIASRICVRHVKFRPGDGTEVSWDDATVEQHQLRIAWQRTLISSVEVDVSRHQAAIALCLRYGVDRLSDIDAWEDKIMVKGAA